MRKAVLPPGTGARLPAFHLGMEEVIARSYPEADAFFAWRTPPTVIIGRNQLIENEVDLAACRAGGIALARRKSGGGAVYADEGNLMFSYVLTRPDTPSAFREAMRMTADVLSAAGVPASLSGRNDVLVEGRKVAGAALYRIGRRVVIHNTLLFSVDLEKMERVLTPPGEKLRSKGVDSVRSRVMNIGERTGMGLDEFAGFAGKLLCREEDLLLTEDNVHEAESIESLLRSPAFVRGHNPRHTLIRRLRTAEAGLLEAYLEIKGDRILDVNLMGDFFVLGELDTDLLARLRGLPFRRDAAAAALTDVPVADIIRGLDTETLLDLLFDTPSQS